MDKKIRTIERKAKTVENDLKSLETADKKRDRLVDLGKKELNDRKHKR